MPRKGTTSVKQDYKYIGVLYPDSESYNYFQVVEAIKDYFDRWAFCVHDSDVDDRGNEKKTHVHWVGVKLTEEGKHCPVPLSAVSQATGLLDHDIEYAKSEKASVRYLVHVDDPDKYQYPISSIKANFSLMKYFRDRAAAMKSKQIYQYIIENRPKSIAEMLGYVFEHELYAEFRRGFAMWDRLISEVNHG